MYIGAPRPSLARSNGLYAACQRAFRLLCFIQACIFHGNHLTHLSSGLGIADEVDAFLVGNRERMSYSLNSLKRLSRAIYRRVL